MAGKRKIVSNLLKYSGIFILCGWMFFLGVLVGRGTSPVNFDTAKFQKKLALIVKTTKLESKPDKKLDFDFHETLKKPVSIANLKSRKKLVKLPYKSEVDNKTAYERDSIHGIFIKKSRKAISIAKLGKKLKDLFGQDGKRIDKFVSANKQQSSHVNNRVNANRSEIKNNDTKKILDKTRRHGSNLGLQSKPVKPDTSIVYTIQIAAYRKSQDALKLMGLLNKKGYKAYKTIGKRGSEIWYRVRIGEFKDISLAIKFKQKLESDKIKGIIIQNDK